MITREPFVPGRAALVQKMRLDNGTNAAVSCSAEMYARVTPWLEKQAHQT